MKTSMIRVSISVVLVLSLTYCIFAVLNKDTANANKVNNANLIASYGRIAENMKNSAKQSAIVRVHNRHTGWFDTTSKDKIAEEEQREIKEALALLDLSYPEIPQHDKLGVFGFLSILSVLCFIMFMGYLTCIEIENLYEWLMAPKTEK